MDLALVLRQRLEQLDLEQRDLAVAAQVTESFISQLLSGRKSPPAPTRTDIYDKLEPLLKFPQGELGRMADLQRQEEIKKKLVASPAPLFKEVRELVLSKCQADKKKQVRVIFEQQPFGEIERLVTQKLLEVAKEVARKELANEQWLRQLAQLSYHSYEQMRVDILDFLDEDVFHLSPQNCVAFLQPLIQSWDIDLKTFGMDIILNHRVAPGRARKFEFVEREPEPEKEEPGLTEFLQTPALCRDATPDEIAFLRKLRFNGKRPTALYYYREIQNLRDPLHFLTPEPPPPGTSAP
jgi:predicted transcriptional regulator